jgi:tRNA-modifying protein YgfZ
MTEQPFPMPSLRALTVTGAEARSFLQNQLSSDVNEVTATRGQLSAWHDPKGRVLAFLRVLPWQDGFALVMRAELADTVEQRLRMYVLRARVTLGAGPAVHAIGPEGAGTASALAGGELGDEPLAAAGKGAVSVLRMPGRAGWLVVGEPGDAAPDAAAAAAWELAEIEAGIPEVFAATSGQFVAQMLNLDRIGAVSFTKGCYPGQEIVARAHHLGRVKRRVRLFRAAGAPPAPGTGLKDSSGTVVRAAASGAGCLLLAVAGEDAPGPFALADGRPLSEEA